MGWWPLASSGKGQPARRCSLFSGRSFQEEGVWKLVAPTGKFSYVSKIAYAHLTSCTLKSEVSQHHMVPRVKGKRLIRGLDLLQALLPCPPQRSPQDWPDLYLLTLKASFWKRGRVGWSMGRVWRLLGL